MDRSGAVTGVTANTVRAPAASHAQLAADQVAVFLALGAAGSLK